MKLFFLAASLLLFITFSSHIEEKLAEETNVGLDNKISFASLTNVSSTYFNLPELPIDAKSLRVSVLGAAAPIYSFKNNIRWPIASLTKLLTAIVAIEKFGFDKEILINSENGFLETDASNLKFGEKFSVHDLIVDMLTISSNNAACSIAAAYGHDNFMQAMRDKAFAIGMRDSSFEDPTGLSALNQSTTSDLEKLTTYIVKYYPELLAISRQKENYITEIISSEKRKLININKFAGNVDFVGGKTGYTDEAMGNLLSIFNWHGENIFIVVLGSNDRFLETEKLYNWAKNRLK